MRVAAPPRWRRLLKDTIASAIWRTRPLTTSFAASRGLRPLVIGYHRVVEDFAEAAETDMPTLLVSRSMFERHIERIGRDFDFVSLDEIGAIVSGERKVAKPVAAITFDDGYRDVYEHAIPFLAAKGIPATVFVVSSLVGRPGWLLHDRLYRLAAKAFERWNDPVAELSRLLGDAGVPGPVIEMVRGASGTPYHAVSMLLPSISQIQTEQIVERLYFVVGGGLGEAPRMLTWPMADDLQRRGFGIGSHTKTHGWLANELPEQALDEIAGSKRAIEEQLGEAVHHFAYPGGQFTPPIVAMVHQAGYRYAYTACDHHDATHPSLTIERLLLWEGSSVDADGHFSSAILNCQTHGLWPPVRRCERVHAA